MLDVHGRENNEAAEGEEEAECDEGEAPASEIRGETEDEQHDCAGDVGCDGVKVSLDGAIALLRLLVLRLKMLGIGRKHIPISARSAEGRDSPTAAAHPSKSQ